MTGGPVATVEISDAQVAGRDAADRLAHRWDDRDWIPETPSSEWARAAVDRLGEIIAAQPSMLRASMKGAGKGASTLSPRPFQGLVECLQEQGQLRASSLRVAYREVPVPELLIVHDGSPVTLANVGAMLLPWLSTKDGDPEASGRLASDSGRSALSAVRSRCTPRHSTSLWATRAPKPASPRQT